MKRVRGCVPWPVGILEWGEPGADVAKCRKMSHHEKDPFRSAGRGGHVTRADGSHRRPGRRIPTDAPGPASRRDLHPMSLPRTLLALVALAPTAAAADLATLD